MVDATEGVIGIEWIDGKSIRTLLGEQDDPEQDFEDDTGDLADTGEDFSDYQTTECQS